MIRVAIADDHKVVRDGLKSAFAKCNDIKVIGEATNSREAAELAESEKPDVLILDVKMEGKSGVELVRRIKEEVPQVKIIIFTMYDEDSFAARFYQAGASGYLGKFRSPEELIEAVRKVSVGGMFITRELAELFLENQVDPKVAPHETLSDRELQIFHLLVTGETPGNIAARLSLSTGTIATYVSRIKNKLGVKTIAHMVQYAFRRNIAE